MPRTTVALLPARGDARGFPESGVKYKALLPLNGRPLIDHVLRSLQASEVERIFIIQSLDEHLERAVTPSDKNVFVTCAGEASSLAGSLTRGAEAILDYYGDKTRELAIMATPCDIPLVQPGEYNRLIKQNLARDADVSVTAVRNKILKESCASRSFRSLFFKDLGEVYTMQAVMFGRGSLLGFGQAGDSRRFTVFDRDGKAIQGLEAMTDSLGDIYVRDLLSNATVRASVNANVLVNGPARCSNPSWIPRYHPSSFLTRKAWQPSRVRRRSLTLALTNFRISIYTM